MRSQSSSPPRTRRALQERSSAHTNERSPTRSLRMVREKEDVDVYTATPFPTKPEQILLPIPGKGQQEYISDTGFSCRTAGPPTPTWLSREFSHPAGSSMRDHSIGESWEVSSTVDTGCSQVWEDDPKPTSSKSSLPDESRPVDRGWDESSETDYSDDEMVVLPTATPTIKAVVSDPPTSPQSSGEDDRATRYSSPNVVPIGVPSSPNFVTLDNSSVNFHPVGTSSNPDSDPRSNSLSSYNSRGTVVRHIGAAPWIYTASSEQLSSRSRSQSFRSSPPVASFRLPVSRSRSATSSSRSMRSVADLQAAIDSGVPIQYPRIRAPSSSSSRACTSSSAERDLTPGPPSGRWNPHLSRISSIWSAEQIMGSSSPADVSGMSEPTQPPANSKPTSSVWLVRDSHEDERQDRLTNLPGRNRLSYSLSSSSKRTNSTRSLKRPGTASSTIFQILPTWAKIYYRCDATVLNSALSMIDASQPSPVRPGTSNSSVFGLMPAPLNVPRPRSPERPRSPKCPQQVQRRVDSDPRDPRAHWVPDPEPKDLELVGTPRHRLHHSWSPHLYQDKCIVQYPTAGWKAPSLDSTTEPLFGRRNIQVYAFCIGFIFPFGM